MGKMKIKRGKKAQLTIFIILGIAILIILILLFMRGKDLRTFFLGRTPVEEIRYCAEESLKEGIGILSFQGGTIEPENYYLYEGHKVDYVCYTEEDFQKCVMQKPLLKNIIEDELKDYIEAEVKGCVESVKESLERKGSSVSLKEPVIDIEIVPEDVLVNIELDLKITKGDFIEAYKNIKTSVGSSLYEFIMIVSSIANLEAEYGDSEITTYMFNNHNLKVEKIKQGDETKIYVLTDRVSLEQFIFAVRSIPIPPGWV